VNYGVLGVLDWLHSTDASFRSSRQYEQHKTYFSLSAYNNTAAASTAPQHNKGVEADDEKRGAGAVGGLGREERKECSSGRVSGSGLGLMGLAEMSEI